MNSGPKKRPAVPVFHEPIFNNGRRFVTRYYGRKAEDVRKEVEEVVKAIDPMRSPKAGAVYRYGVFHAQDVTYYGLD